MKVKKPNLKVIGINKIKKEMRTMNYQNGERKNAWNRKECIQGNKWILLSLKERNITLILKREY